MNNDIEITADINIKQNENIFHSKSKKISINSKPKYNTIS